MDDRQRPIEIDRAPRGPDRLVIPTEIHQEHGPKVMQLARERVLLRRRGADPLGLPDVLVRQRPDPQRDLGPVGAGWPRGGHARAKRLIRLGGRARLRRSLGELRLGGSLALPGRLALAENRP
jgi:hypothetical protein